VSLSVPGSIQLEPAHATDLDAVVALQHAAYARNMIALGVVPQPMAADYAAIFRDMEVWLHRDDDSLAGALILQPRPDDLLIWNISVAPARQGEGLGNALLAAADARARDLGYGTLRLYTGTLLTRNWTWYQRHGYAIERIEELPDRSVTHMIKHLPATA
jgi:ribosomal protein S18 acetylase RimI-like enzyme